MNDGELVAARATAFAAYTVAGVSARTAARGQLRGALQAGNWHSMKFMDQRMDGSEFKNCSLANALSYGDLLTSAEFGLGCMAVAVQVARKCR